MTNIRWIEVAAVGSLATALGAALLVPPEQTQGDLARMLFVHVPSIWLAYVAFVVTLVGSTAYLRTRNRFWDRLAAGSAEVGVLFTGAAIAMGMIWAKPTWSVWWTWDARLVLTAVMFFVYLGYLALRRAIIDPEVRARRAAIFGILGVLQIPLIHFSVVWWRTLHQPATILRPDLDLQLDAPFAAAMWMAVVAFTVVYIALVGRRMELARLEDALEERLSEPAELAESGITAPRLQELRDHV